VEESIRARLIRWVAHDVPIPDRGGLRRFGAVIGSACIALFGLLLPWRLRLPYPRWPLVVGGLLLAAALTVPHMLRILYVPWMRLALLLNRLTMPLVAGAVFFLVISPLAWFMRLAGKDPMARRFDREAVSYRVSSRNPSPSHMERPF
jgi:hypothetical protein